MTQTVGGIGGNNMFRASLHIINPWAKDGENSFRNFFCAEDSITTNKNYCLEFMYHNRDLFEFTLDLKWRGQDHAGPDLMISFLTFGMHASLYDRRHWNDETDNWYTQAEIELQNANYENSEKDRLG